MPNLLVFRNPRITTRITCEITIICMITINQLWNYAIQDVKHCAYPQQSIQDRKCNQFNSSIIVVRSTPSNWAVIVKPTLFFSFFRAKWNKFENVSCIQRFQSFPAWECLHSQSQTLKSLASYAFLALFHFLFFSGIKQ